MYLTTSCEDGDFPWPRSARPSQRRADSDRELARLGDRAFAPFDHWVGQQYGAVPICAPWPEAGARPAPPAVPNVPTLLLVGGDDDVAPLEGAREIAAALPRSSIVTIPDWGHGVLEDDPPAASALARWAKRFPGSYSSRTTLPVAPRPSISSSASARLLQREARADDRPDEARGDQAVDRRADLAVHLRLGASRRRPSRRRSTSVLLQQQAVDLAPRGSSRR